MNYFIQMYLWLVRQEKYFLQMRNKTFCSVQMNPHSIFCGNKTNRHLWYCIYVFIIWVRRRSFYRNKNPNQERDTSPWRTTTRWIVPATRTAPTSPSPPLGPLAAMATGTTGRMMATVQSNNSTLQDWWTHNTDSLACRSTTTYHTTVRHCTFLLKSLPSFVAF